MRKIVCSAVALLICVVPLFAQEAGDMPEREKSEIVLKLEIAPAGQINTKNSISPGVSFDGEQIADNTGFYLAGEYFYYIFKFLGLGAGIKQQFERHIKDFGDLSITNLYLSVKPKLQLRPEAYGSECKEFVYLIFQGGYGILNNAYELRHGGADIATSTENGLYYAGGIGFQLNNFIFEIVFNVNESKIEGKDGYSGTMDATYTTTNLNVGYRIGF
ncbi:MAG: outer membrane beta-barrel protein [Endomicrobia bacterium]|nr:outer membrane beta-barrel protein [Endomicrobiia bacterium]MCL2799642.1 outer membrane beta-barrel protein [Endomicrobiia bacterium]